MIDLHTHTTFSDGHFNPAEHIRRAEVAGYHVVAMTDHADASMLEIVIPNIRKIVDENNKYNDNIKAVCGIELTHVLPETIAGLVKRSRDLGADLVNIHGETIVEPVLEGTNMAAIDAGVDIIYHPGLITDDEVALAAEKGICLEITSRKGHSLTNGYVYQTAKKCGAKLVFNNDAHTSEDFVSQEMADKIMKGCGMTEGEVKGIFKNSEDIAKKIL
jgi:histidinol phosphatase-like PHP family hydrolase